MSKGKPIIVEVPSRSGSIIAVNPENNTVVASGNKIRTVLEKAGKAGVEKPSVMFVPKPGQRYIY